MKPAPIQLASTNSESVHADVRKIYPEWNGSRQTLRLRADLSIIDPPDPEDPQPTDPSPSGYRLDIIPIRDRILQEAEYDEEGNQLSPPRYAGETRIDLIAPPGFEWPEFETRVEPDTPDMRYA